MSSIGTGYDLEASTFSPDGRIFQVEYAAKAIENSGTAIALRGKDGVVIVVEKLVATKMYEPSSNRRVCNIDEHIAFGASGVYPDSLALAQFCIEEATDYYSQYRSKIPCKFLSDRLSHYVHAYTLYGMVRPFGCSVFLGSWDAFLGPQLYLVEPSGLSYSYFGWAIGKGRQAAKTEIEKIANMSEKSCSELLREAARILHMIRDQAKDKNVVLEMCWVGKHTGGKAQLVPEDVVEEAENYAKQKLNEDDSDVEMH